jgi:hypothetical protein
VANKKMPLNHKSTKIPQSFPRLLPVKILG